jgi:hypothetical protein
MPGRKKVGEYSTAVAPTSEIRRQPFREYIKMSWIYLDIKELSRRMIEVYFSSFKKN